jgi:CheY-like chemotaxis protein
MRILIAEDDRVTARLLTKLAAGWGYETVVRIEEDASTHADVTFSHGICPRCLPLVTQEMTAGVER